MKILCTFSGKIGDILWSLPTVRQISRNYGVKVDMGIMPSYKTLLPMLKLQSYIETPYVIEDWYCTGSPAGDQPWEPQCNERLQKEYDKVFHLTYRYHPHGNQPLVDFIARQQSIVLDDPICPFIETRDYPPYTQTYVAYAFNEMYKDLKSRFMECLSTELGHGNLSSSTPIEFYDVSKAEWALARYGMKHALAFVGCRSSNHVLAHGIGQKNIFIYEPCVARHHQGSFGNTFSNPHWNEVCGPLVSSPEVEAKRAAQYIGQWLKEKEYESYEVTSR